MCVLIIILFARKLFHTVLPQLFVLNRTDFLNVVRIKPSIFFIGIEQFRTNRFLYLTINQQWIFAQVYRKQSIRPKVDLHILYA